MKRKAISLRASLIEQGVTCETALKAHLNFVYETLLVNPLMDIRRYRVNPKVTAADGTSNPATTLSAFAGTTLMG